MTPEEMTPQQMIKGYSDNTAEWACTKQYIQNALDYLKKTYNNSTPAPQAIAFGIVELACCSVIYNVFTADGKTLTDKQKQELRQLCAEASNYASPYLQQATFGDYQSQNTAKTAKGAAAGGIIGALLGGNWLGVGLSAVAGGLIGSSNKKEPDYNTFFTAVRAGIKAWYTYFIQNVNKLKFIDEPKAEITEKSSDDAIQKSVLNAENKLNELIGLKSIKRQILLLKASIKKQKKLKNKINLHMCFYGNPGTGKTEVARLIADIFYKEKILKTNKVVETDRAGLIGKYQGHTAIKTHEIFESAMGGVLFIDEAYSIDGGEQDDYGKEAVAALLKDMEDHRDEICVILAGYKKPMIKLFQTNPGFKSRVNRIIEFPNYSKSELKEILLLIAKNAKYKIEENAVNKIIDIVDAKRYEDDFANAREVRNVFDAVVEIQALRTEDDETNTTIKLCDVKEYLKNLEEEEHGSN